MNNYRFKMVRTYVTYFEVEAEHLADAKAKAWDSTDKYRDELDQCYVTDEEIVYLSKVDNLKTTQP